MPTNDLIDPAIHKHYIKLLLHAINDRIAQWRIHGIQIEHC